MWGNNSTATPPFLTSAVDKSQWPASCLGCFIPRETAPGIQCTEGWVGYTAGLDVMEKRKMPAPVSSQTLAGQPVACNYTDWAIYSSSLFKSHMLLQSSGSKWVGWGCSHTIQPGYKEGCHQILWEAEDMEPGVHNCIPLPWHNHSGLLSDLTVPVYHSY
jgi:hypothetical protein